MLTFSLSPKEMIASCWRNRYLIRKSVQREVVGRYRGSFLGILWSFFHPLFMLAVYTFVFSVVFKARWQTTGESKTEFALILFSGLMVFNLFAIEGYSHKEISKMMNISEGTSKSNLSRARIILQRRVGIFTGIGKKLSNG